MHADARSSPLAGAIIRQEHASELAEIHTLIRTAFESARYREGDEQDFVWQLRQSGDYLPELTLVLEEEGRLSAHLMLTRTTITTAAGALPILFLACIAVVEERRNCGVGRAMIEAALLRGREQGYTAVILVGDAAYYSRVGFLSAAHFGIINQNQIPAEHVLMRELIPGALRGVCGSVLLPF